MLVTSNSLRPSIANGSDVRIGTVVRRFPLGVTGTFMPSRMIALSNSVSNKLRVANSASQPLIGKSLILSDISIFTHRTKTQFAFSGHPMRVGGDHLAFSGFTVFAAKGGPFAVSNAISFQGLASPEIGLSVLTRGCVLLGTPHAGRDLMCNGIFISFGTAIHKPMGTLIVHNGVGLLNGASIACMLVSSPLAIRSQLKSLIAFASFDSAAAMRGRRTPIISLNKLSVVVAMRVSPKIQLGTSLDTSHDDQMRLRKKNGLDVRCAPRNSLSLSNQCALANNVVGCTLPIVPLGRFGVGGNDCIR